MSRLVASAVVLSCLIPLSRAQFDSGIQGSVTDEFGARIPEATVTLISDETQRTAETQTTGDGFYRFSGLAPGRYTIQVRKEGFQSLTQTGVNVRAEQLEGVDLQLAIGDVSFTVTVSGSEAPALQTEDASISRSITREEIARLPQLNRDPYELVRLTPGVFGYGGRTGAGGSSGLPNTTGPGGSNLSIFQTENQVPISANGQRLSNNNFQIDGVSVNSLGWGGAAVITPNQESVKEITVRASAYSAEYGRNSGAQIQVVSQNGTNELHGSAFFKYNSPGLNAFNRYGGVNAPPVRVENRFRQFGGSLGGPIVKNRLFFFFSFEGLRNKADNPENAWVETAQFREDVLRLRPDGISAQILGAPGVEPRIGAALQAECPTELSEGGCQQVTGGLDLGSIAGRQGGYLSDITGGGLDGVADVQFVQLRAPIENEAFQYNPRIDYSVGVNSFAFSSYITPRSDTSVDVAGRSRPMGDLKNSPLSSAYTLTYIRTFGATTVNEARVNLTRFASDQVEASSETNFGIPRIEIEGYPFDRIRWGPPRAETTPAVFAQNTYDFSDTISHFMANHALKAGVTIRKEQNNNNLVGGARPLYSFQGLFNFANDAPVFEAINADPVTGLPADAQRYLRTSDYSIFIHDDWKARPNLTFNLGLRWEYFTPLTEKRDQLGNLIFGPNLLEDARVQVIERLTEPDRNNFAPRFGFAYSPGRFRDRLVIRGGFGVFYNRIPGSVFANTAGNPPFFARYNLCCGNVDSPFAGGDILYALGQDRTPFSYPVNPSLAEGIDPETGAPNAGAVEIYMAGPETPNSYVYIWSLDTQYRLPANFVLDVGYQASAGHKQIRLVNQNFLFPNNPAFFAVHRPQPDVNSNFNALLVGLRRNYQNGLQVATNYRWSKSIDTLSYEGPGAVTNQTWPQDLSTERGPSDFDVKHFWTGSALYDLPFFRSQTGIWGQLLGGFSINAILTARTGFPWTPKTGQSVTTPGGPSLAPTRPIAYFCCALDDRSDEAFIRPEGNFPGGGRSYFDISEPGFPGIGRNSFRGPGYFAADFSVMKRNRLPFLPGEAGTLEFRANLYNAFNNRNLAPFNFLSAGTYIENEEFFGRADAGLSGRVVELQLRLSF